MTLRDAARSLRHQRPDALEIEIVADLRHNFPHATDRQIRAALRSAR